MAIDRSLNLRDHAIKRSGGRLAAFAASILDVSRRGGVAMKRAWGSAVLAAGVIAALGACSDSSDGAADSTTVVATATTSTTSAPRTSTTSATTSGTSSTSTSAPPTTVALEAQIRASYSAAYEAYWACLREPDTCDPTALTASTGPARASLTDAVNQLRSSDLKVGPDDFGYMVIEAVSVDASGQAAQVQACWWDTGVVYGPPATEGGDPVVVNNLQVTARFDTTMVLEAGEWRISEEVRTARVEGVNECPREGS